MSADSAVRVVLVYPALLGTYGDRGNAAALVHRAKARGITCEVVDVGLHDPLPDQGDVYLIGGGEDLALLLAWERLRADGALARAVSAGAACLGVCAGIQLLSHEFCGPDGRPREGLGLLDVRCGRLTGPRAVGEVLARGAVPGLDELSGFENHQGDAVLGPGAVPLGWLERGVGNGDGRTEGIVQGNVVGTYLHGPVLVRNGDLADRLLETVTGPLPHYEHAAVRRLREERRTAALGSPRRRLAGLLRRSDPR